MKLRFSHSILVLSTLAVGFGLSLVQPNKSLAQYDDGYRPHEREHHPEKFLMGVCVGQLLEQQGITIQMPAPGQELNLDPDVREALQTAVQSCRAQSTGASPSPSPSVNPSVTPSLNPTAAPSGMPSAAPTTVVSSPAPTTT